MYYIYLIKNINFDWVYVGSTANIERRLAQHNAGEVRSTRFRRPYILIHHETFASAKEAREREKYIKSNRIEKERLVRQYTALSSNG